MRISDWSSDVCSSDLCTGGGEGCSAVAVAAGLAGRDRQHEIPDRTLEGAAVGMERQVEAEMPLREIGGELTRRLGQQIGRASCRERVCQSVYIPWVAEYLQKKTKHKKQLKTKP